MHAGTCPIRAVAEAPWGSGDAHAQSTAMRRPRPQAVRARDASLLPFRLPARPSPGAPWARGLLSVFWERGGDIKARRTSRGSHDVSRDDRHQAGASVHSILVSSLVQRGQAQARSTEASGKGCHFGATRPRPGGLRDGGHRGAQDGVTTRAFGRRRLLLSG